MPVVRLCKHGTRLAAGQKCPLCKTWDTPNRGRRWAGREGKNYDNAHWRKVRAQAIARDRCCVDCGTTEKLQGDLMVGNDHSQARVDDVQTRCARCHQRRHNQRTRL